MIGIAIAKVGSINDQIITCLVNGDMDDIAATWNEGFRVCVCIRVEIAAYKARKSDAVIIRSAPVLHNIKDFLEAICFGKLAAEGKICLQLPQKIGKIMDAAATNNVGNRIVITNITLMFSVLSANAGIAMAHTMATASSAAMSF